MAWNEPIFRYCERGLDPSFWAEPFNALSNAAFLIVAGAVFVRLRRLNPMPHTAAVREVTLLLVLAGSIGVGSFIFHTFATRAARMADVAPIAAFMCAYLVFALRWFAGLSNRATALSLAGFLALMLTAASVSCPQSGVTAAVTGTAREPCLKGAMGYIPALAALVVTGLLIRNRHAAGRSLLIAACILGAAMIARWIDRDVCAATVILGAPRGTHALWHLLNAATIYVMLAAAIEGVRQRRP